MQKPEGWLAAVRRMRTAAGAVVAAALLSTGQTADAADPVRGAALYATAARPGMLPCADCHAENPIVDNFGNIWSGRNAVALIQRAVQSNTGGMSVFQGIYGLAELADIAAYLGNAPNSLSFAPAVTGTTGATRTVTIGSSLKVGIDALTLATEGDFVLTGGTCGNSVPRFSSCSVEIAFRPTAVGARAGTLVIDHAGTPTPVRLPLGGVGLPPPAVAQVQPLRVDFGELGLRRHVEVANFSPSPLKLLALSSAPAEFAIAGGTCLAGLTLATGQRCTMALRAPPRHGAPQRGTVRISHDGVGGGSEVDLLASGGALPAPMLFADAAALAFGTQPVGAAVPSQFADIANFGTEAVTLGEVGASDAAFALDESSCVAGLRLAPQQACRLVVTYRPQREGPLTAELRLATREPGPELRLALSAQAAASALAAAPDRLALQAAVGQTARATLALVNAGSAPWRVGRLAFSGPEASDFALAEGGTCKPGAAVWPGATCTVGVSFTPQATGTRLARLKVETDGGSVDIGHSGWATAAAAAEVWLDAGTVDFGVRATGDAGAARSIVAHNGGSAPLRWSHVALAGMGAERFTLGGDCLAGAVLEVGGSCRVELRFVPDAPGEHGATLVLWHEGGSAPAAASLRGRAVSATSAKLVVDRAAIDFGHWPLQPVAAMQRIRVRNLGSAAAPALAISIDDAAFTLARADAACRGGLAPGTGCAIDIAFRPTASGARQGTLLIQAAGLPAMAVPLAGAAVPAAPLLAWQPPGTAPGHAPAFVGAPSTGPSWTLVNLGNAPSAPLRWVIDGAAAGDYSLAVGTTCEAGRVLAPGGTCTLQTSFHPQAAGPREARLVLASDSIDPLALEGRGIARALPSLRATPASLVFQARTAAVAGPQHVRLLNEGTALLRIDTIGIEGAAFSVATSAADACGGELRVLMPGEACELTVVWDGSAAGALGGRLVLETADAPGASVPLLVREDPAQGTNVGGGAWHGWWLLALLMLPAILRPLRSESRHG